VRKGDGAMRDAVNQVLSAERASGALNTLSLQWLKQPLDAKP
jgi:ABC-type amino acid transport substrate-binding protein